MTDTTTAEVRAQQIEAYAQKAAETTRLVVTKAFALSDAVAKTSEDSLAWARDTFAKTKTAIDAWWATLESPVSAPPKTETTIT